jgi:hypothetical protein
MISPNLRLRLALYPKKYHFFIEAVQKVVIEFSEPEVVLRYTAALPLALKI